MNSRRHLIWFLCDQLRYDAVGFNGNDLVRTPNLDRLAAAGTVFDNCFVQYPTCMASRGSLLTGRYPQATRMANGTPLLDPRETTLPEALQRQGWRTGMFGKLHVTPQEYTARTLGSTRPIADWHAFLDDAGLWPIAEDAAKQTYGFQHLVPFEDILWGAYVEDWLPTHDPALAARFANGRMAPEVWQSFAPGTFLGDAGSRPIPAELHPSMFVGESAAEYFRQNHADGPCYLHVSFVDPHHPFDPPAEVLDTYDVGAMPLPRYAESGALPLPPTVRDRYERAVGPPGQVTEDLTRQTIACYYAMMEMVDRAVGRVVDAVEAAGQLDNCVFLFTADHGEFLGDYGCWRKPTIHYDCLTRVPCFVAAPGLVPGGQRCAGLVEEVDLAPTVLDLLGVAPWPGVQGRSVAGPLHDPTTPTREDVFTQSHWAPAAGPYCNCLTVRTQTAKLHYYPDDDHWLLLDLANDPDERRNLSTDPARRALRDEMTGRLLRRLYNQQDPLPRQLSQY